MRYTIYANGVRVCPKCAAGMKLLNGIYRCVDCGARFEIVGEGQTDKELELEEVE